jgi:xanthine dehydrogenase molybdenum-binding subunit
LPAAERQQIADSFTAVAGLQCGFCIPGIALRAKAITDRDREPTREAIAAALDVHLCRCTGYVKIIEAVQAVGGSTCTGMGAE